ncbi:hypothetical protein DLM77_07700 [Leptospira yasudae]|uniref:Uncharacterized protein n=1 Tax=Leptospira yasudae TaxID=2202201 RepID=A0ABX9M5U2_9LEPT|nr:hypothetical protein DLM77_07700 [Leptospira yasudae]
MDIIVPPVVSDKEDSTSSHSLSQESSSARNDRMEKKIRSSSRNMRIPLYSRTGLIFVRLFKRKVSKKFSLNK